MRKILQSAEERQYWSRRARERLTGLRQELAELCGIDGGSVIARRANSLEWWTFAGLAANQTVGQYLTPDLGKPIRADNLSIRLPEDVTLVKLNQAIRALQQDDAAPEWDLHESADDLLKFGNLLPDRLLRAMVLDRIADVPRALRILRSAVSVRDARKGQV